MKCDVDGFTRAGETIGPVLKEIVRRAELRARIEAEQDLAMDDDEFLRVAQATGLRI